ncbi:MAG: T9SS type A sorting domain-containing protein [Paludibacter sp.]|nr:T9SS type A sorting domain-containing protein [Paludibacter sp.]
MFNNVSVKITDFTTSVDKLSADAQNAISIYPVPVKDYACVTFKNAIKAKVNVYTLTGVLVKTQNIMGASQINLNSLDS